MEDGICLERESGIRVRRTQDGQHIAVIVENRSVHRIETDAADILPMYIVTLVAVHDIAVRIRVRPGTENHLLEHLRSRSVEHLSSWSVKRYVRAGIITDIIDNSRHIGSGQCLIRR